RPACAPAPPRPAPQPRRGRPRRRRDGAEPDRGRHRPPPRRSPAGRRLRDGGTETGTVSPLPARRRRGRLGRVRRSPRRVRARGRTTDGHQTRPARHRRAARTGRSRGMARPPVVPQQQRHREPGHRRGLDRRAWAGDRRRRAQLGAADARRRVDPVGARADGGGRGGARVSDGGGPLIVQSDRTLLLDVDHADAEAARNAIAPFAELERSPEHVHTYRLTPLGLWNASAAGHDAEQVVDALLRWSRYPVPQSVLVDVAETMARYGRLVLEIDPVHGLVLRATDRAVLEEVVRAKHVAPLVGVRIDPDTVAVPSGERGRLKQALLKVGWPAEDRAGYVDGTPYAFGLLEGGFTLRPYQLEAAAAFEAAGSGVVVLPCGA